MKISVIIPTMHRPEDVQVALTSLAHQTKFPEQILVVDQSVDDKTKQVIDNIKAQFPQIEKSLQYIYREEKGSARARNWGWRLATGDIVSFLDDDVKLFPDYYEKVAQFFDSNPDVGGLSGNTLLDAKFEGLGWVVRQKIMKLFLLSDWNGHMTPSGFGHPIYEREIEQLTEVDLLPGSNMSFRASVTKEDRFDEWFVGYSYKEDVDLSYRISRKTKLVMIPDAKLWHYSSPANRLDFERLKKMEAQNNHYIFRKHKNTHLLSGVVFIYSALGSAGIDLLEFLRDRDPLTFRRFRAGILAYFDALRNP